ncbi:hypothetical protein [Hyphomicrobium sp. LHD-15]|uniref:hypothetical protein n=1 Tax=Hyphomicrobium sp. LHD-15 TaxID=3072142 RepID=UPI00280CBFA5|nr:hypothetical protein [Hyphomicrobium sp. LHD-15]MDQ8699012.1 hypothetical protein [Hyphomicrobium sp. LHD-15]
MAPERAAIEEQLEAIFASEAFSSAPKMRSLLRYLVDATLAGDVDRLKGYAIGVDVFERGEAFDPGTDPIVRVQAGRLRKLLEAYYHAHGGTDSIRIEIPKGGYAVEFLTSGAEPATAAVSASEGPIQPKTSRWNVWSRAGHLPLAAPIGVSALVLLVFLSVFFGNKDAAERGSPSKMPADYTANTDAITFAVLPFANMSEDASKTGFADGLTDALTTAFARVKSISLASRTSAFQYRAAADLRQVGRELGVRYILEGGLQHDGERMSVNVQLIDALTGAHLWAQKFDRPAGDDLINQGELVAMIAAEVRPQLFGAAKRAIRANAGPQATAWQLYMQSTWMPGEARNSLAWEKERVALATRALEIDPDLGAANSVLADKLSYLANVDPPSDTEEARNKATEHARRALERAPADADVMFNLSVHHWHAGRIKESFEATQRTLELDPNHVLARFLVKAIPFTCSDAPQGVIDELVAFDAAISSDNPVRWVTLTWISLLYLNNGDFARAADAARRSDQVFRTPNTFYRLAAILVQLGEVKAAVEQIKQQQDNWPNLSPRHYADVVIPRRCGDAPKAAFLRRVYGDLADAFEAARRGG